jgi:hypothetical protein
MKQLVLYGPILGLLFSIRILALEIFIITDETQIIGVKLEDSVSTLRKKIKDKLQLKNDNFYLVHDGLLVRGKGSLEDHGIRELSSISVNLSWSDYSE